MEWPQICRSNRWIWVRENPGCTALRVRDREAPLVLGWNLSLFPDDSTGGLSAGCAHGGLAGLFCSTPSQWTATHALWPCMVTGQERGKLKLGDVGLWPPPQPPLLPLSGLLACLELDTVARKCHRQTLKARNTPSPPHCLQHVTHLFAFYLYLGYQRLFDSALFLETSGPGS